MTVLQRLRYLLCLPMNLFWVPENPSENELYSFVEIAGFYGVWGVLIWWILDQYK
ncbi:hypothetical protein SAMN05444359_12649 [Neolewinella agarilytica]|uniref:Uncharacterized protein n=1 Tax=Neolewinella agarilytica TaxID=478744 RepID=A0A1H9LZT0_9BACT|nr:hypothetical protein SAMN05444359_12649 [Neolewinella agarilytica]